jgi:hypothetical protein
VVDVVVVGFIVDGEKQGYKKSKNKHDPQQKN